MQNVNELLKKIALNNEEDDIYSLLDVFLEHADTHIEPFKGGSVHEDDLRQECALVISEHLLTGRFLEKQGRREALLEGDEDGVQNVFFELVHEISESCREALQSLKDSEERTGKAAREVLAKVNEINEGAQDFFREYGIKATPKELSEFLGVDEEKIIEAVELSGYEIKNIDFDTPVRDGRA